MFCFVFCFVLHCFLFFCFVFLFCFFKNNFACRNLRLTPVLYSNFKKKMSRACPETADYNLFTYLYKLSRVLPRRWLANQWRHNRCHIDTVCWYLWICMMNRLGSHYCQHNPWRTPLLSKSILLARKLSRLVEATVGLALCIRYLISCKIFIRRSVDNAPMPSNRSALIYV